MRWDWDDDLGGLMALAWLALAVGVLVVISIQLTGCAPLPFQPLP